MEELALTAARNSREAPITFPFISMIAESIKLDDEKESVTVESGSG